MKPSLEMMLEQSSGQKFPFLGRESLFTHKEAQRFLKKYAITLTTKLEEGVGAVIEYHSLNPVEEDISCEAYDQKIPLYKLEDFERLLSHTLVDDQVLMGLKLSNDQKRLYTLITNTHISDALFIKLLEMYRWTEDEEEDNNEDRGVVMATMRRFLDIKPNEEDLLFSPLTLKKLIGESRDPALLNALLTFPNFRFMQKGKQWITLREAIAASPYIDESGIEKLLRFRENKVLFYLAANRSVPLALLKKFSDRNLNDINEALASNSTIDNELFAKLLEKGEGARQTLLVYQPIDERRFEMIEASKWSPETYALLGHNGQIDPAIVPYLIKEGDPHLLQALAANPSLLTQLLNKLYEMENNSLYPSLAANPSTSLTVLKKLYNEGRDDQAILASLAGNFSTPEQILRELFELDIFEINEKLASNESLPLELLNILKIDTRLRNALTGNKTFTDSITRQLGL